MKTHPDMAVDEADFVIRLVDEAATRRLGALLGELWPAALTEAGPRTLLLYGDLGAGKTTFIRGIVAALPGGELAEVSSPSFTICNSYPTRPELVHCDLFRAGGALPEEAEEALEEGGLLAVEWAERLEEAALPPSRLDIHLRTCQEHRLVRVTARGAGAARLARALSKAGETALSQRPLRADEPQDSQ